jgi:hypothetical protein
MSPVSVRITVIGVRSSWAMTDRKSVRIRSRSFSGTVASPQCPRSTIRRPRLVCTYRPTGAPRATRTRPSDSSSVMRAWAAPGRSSAPSAEKRRSMSATVAPCPTNASAAAASGELAAPSVVIDRRIRPWLGRPGRGPQHVVRAGARPAGDAPGTTERDADMEHRRADRRHLAGGAGELDGVGRMGHGGMDLGAETCHDPRQPTCTPPETDMNGP